MESFTLEKWVWTEADFHNMGWHDASIYAMRMDGDLWFDVDYIFKWNKPELEHFHFTFFVAPCTLCFKQVHELSFELSQPLYDHHIEISDIDLEVREGKQYYSIITEQGYLTFASSGYTQTVRMYPSFQLGQNIAFDERGGSSFNTNTDNKLDPKVQESVNERRAKEYEHYTWAKKKHMLKTEMDALQRKRDANEIPLKDFLKAKNHLKEKLAYYNIILRGTTYQND